MGKCMGNPTEEEWGERGRKGLGSIHGNKATEKNRTSNRNRGTV